MLTFRRRAGPWPTLVERLGGLCIPLLAGVWAVASPAFAQTGTTSFMAEPDAFTDVLDAFDGEDPVDVRVSLGFHTDITGATIQREDPDEEGDAVAISDAERVVKTLRLRVEVGLFRDLSVAIGLPFVMEDQQRLTASGDMARALAALQEAAPGQATTSEQGPSALFDPDLTSRLRDGIPHLELGLAWSPFNQFRSPGLPTWTLRWDNEIGTGAAMEPCLEGGSCSRGTSRGTWRTELGSRWSYRYRLVEPLLGISHAFEVPTAASGRFEPFGPLAGDAGDAPPSETTVAGGATVIPWEDRASYQRLSLTALVLGTHVTAGRGYSFLFDALGTATHPYLAQTVEAEGGSTAVPAFLGLTQAEAHLRFMLRLVLRLQAARHVRFTAGMGIGRATPHALTGAPPCLTGAAGSPTGCREGAGNPLHHAVIDLPGKRFVQRTASILNLFAQASGQF